MIEAEASTEFQSTTASSMDPLISDLVWILTWAVTWVVPFGIFELLLCPAGYGPFGSPLASSPLFLLATAFVVWRYRDLLGPLPDRPAFPAAALLCASLSLTVAAAVFVTRWQLPPQTFERYRSLGIGLIRMDGPYYGMKLTDLCYQQSLILVLVRRLQTRSSGFRLLLAFSLVFGAIHLPILWLKGLAGLGYVLAAATAGALVFPPLILALRQGVLASFGAHLLGYVAAGLMLRKWMAG